MRQFEMDGSVMALIWHWLKSEMKARARALSREIVAKARHYGLANAPLNRWAPLTSTGICGDGRDKSVFTTKSRP
jgi:hypothetical protein